MPDQISSTVENGQKTALNQSICVYIILKQEFVHPKFFALGVDSSKLPSQLRQLLEVGLARQASEAVSRLFFESLKLSSALYERRLLWDYCDCRSQCSLLCTAACWMFPGSFLCDLSGMIVRGRKWPQRLQGQLFYIGGVGFNFELNLHRKIMNI